MKKRNAQKMPHYDHRYGHYVTFFYLEFKKKKEQFL